MPETREEAVRREFGKWAQEQIPKIADGGGNLPLAWLSWQASREAALREAVEFTVNDLLEGESNSRITAHKQRILAALIPVAEKEEKA